MSKSLQASKGGFDWLKDFDYRARGFSRADDWTEYSFFAFARKPRLRPPPVSNFSKVGHQYFQRHISEWQRRIAADSKGDRIFHELSQSQRKQLAALMSDIADDFERYRDRKRAKEWARGLGREGARRQRRATQKAATAIKAVKSLKDYASGLDAFIGTPFKNAANAALEPLRQVRTIESFEMLTKLETELRPRAANPITFSQARLYWFFRSGCDLAGDEAEVRVGLLRNSFWGDFGVPPVAVIEFYNKVQSMACQAVHQAVRRFRPR